MILRINYLVLRLEIVCRPKTYRRFKSSSLRQQKRTQTRVRFSLLRRRDCVNSALAEVHASEVRMVFPTFPPCSRLSDALLLPATIYLLCALFNYSHIQHLQTGLHLRIANILHKNGRSKNLPFYVFTYLNSILPNRAF